MPEIFFGQNCDIHLNGRVIDHNTDKSLSQVNIYLYEKKVSTTTNKRGEFSIKNLCKGEYHISFSHIGCNPQRIHLKLSNDTSINVELLHSIIELHSVNIKKKKERNINRAEQKVSKQTIEDNLDKNISNLLESEAGIQSLKNGNSRAKPIIHGLFGQRITILNNGIPQAGQQWGDDHSPEIDAQIANKITIVKGTNTLEYPDGNKGGVILLEPRSIKREPHLHGHVGYSYITNGRGHNLNAQLEKFSNSLSWRVNATYKKSGDQKTSKYFLNNSGLEEYNFSVQLEKSWKQKYILNTYFSSFNTEIGVLRGSHIGNLSDLEQALNRETPFFTEDNFSYKIEAPRQQVSHHLGKIKLKYLIDKSQKVDIALAGQINNREEYDVRRSGRSDIPALSLLQYSLFGEVKYLKKFSKKWYLKIGNQSVLTDNTNDPNTGILPLIPDYVSIKSGIFTTLEKQWKSSTFNYGIRYDYQHQDVAQISTTIPREILRFKNNYHNFSTNIGYTYEFLNHHSIELSSGYKMRNPGINELYSNGLHQGVSGIEEGDISLSTENTIKNTVAYKTNLFSKIELNTLAYYQRIFNYIFLNPDGEIRQTIRGAFPVFNYSQTEAEIFGFDIQSQISFSNNLIGNIAYQYIRGNDLSNDIPLINIPSNMINTKLTYRVNKTLSFFNNRIKDFEIVAKNKYVFRQTHILASQDFVLPPDPYNLLGLSASANILLPKNTLRIYLNIENLLNSQYRNYLNRQRYFADDLGTSIVIGGNLKF